MFEYFLLISLSKNNEKPGIETAENNKVLFVPRFSYLSEKSNRTWNFRPNLNSLGYNMGKIPAGDNIIITSKLDTFLTVCLSQINKSRVCLQSLSTKLFINISQFFLVKKTNIVVF